jgi:hypothetical protein
MASGRWLNLLLWGLGERQVGDSDMMTDLLLVIDAFIWFGLFIELLRTGVKLFLAYWFLAPIIGEPIYWIVTQLAVGYAITRIAMKHSGSKIGPKPTPSGAPAAPVSSDEP